VSFDVAADAYDRFMGRYSAQLSPQLADLGRVGAGQRALDVGCGPGALTAELVVRLGAAAGAAVDPSEPFVEAARRRNDGAHVSVATAEDLPFGDGEFDVTLAQLVVPFMREPVVGLREMRRVTRRDGIVAACVWDHAGGQAPLTAFWDAARELEPGVRDESEQAGAGQGKLAALLAAAGLDDVEETVLRVRVQHASFEDWWQPFTLGVGPAGAYLAGLDLAARAELRAGCRRRLSDEPLTLGARAWGARGRA
jgi:SAM-dependent methyltransferase